MASPPEGKKERRKGKEIEEKKKEERKRRRKKGRKRKQKKEKGRKRHTRLGFLKTRHQAGIIFWNDISDGEFFYGIGMWEFSQLPGFSFVRTQKAKKNPVGFFFPPGFMCCRSLDRA